LKEDGRVKIGAENKKQVIIMAVLLAVAVAVVIYDFSGSGTSSAAPPAPAAPATAGSQRARTSTQQVAQNDLDPTLRLDVLEASRRVKYEAGGRNIFRMEEPPPPKPIAAVRATPTPFPTPTPTPPPPPIPLKFYGFANRPGEAKKVFLSEGDPQNSNVFIAKQGDIVNRRYRVVQISATSVQIEDVLYNNKQTIPLTAR
jgi:hypothetical protein